MSDRDNDAWTEPPTGEGMRDCCMCDKPTGSHALRLREGEGGKVEPGSADDFSFLFAVCHSCYEEYSAQDIADSIRRFDDLIVAGLTMETIDALGDMTRYSDTNRTKAVGTTAVHDVLTDVDVGHVVKLNGMDHKFVSVPGTPQEIIDELAKIGAELAHILTDMGGEASAGGLVKSVDPSEKGVFYVYVDADDAPGAELEIMEVKTLEIIGEFDLPDPPD